MKKKLIIGGVIGMVLLLLLGGGGFFGYMLYTKLSEYQGLGDINKLQQLGKDNADLIKKNEELESRFASLQKQFAVFRKQTIDKAENRAERKVATSEASFTALSGAYVLAATASHEQLEACQDIQALIQFEAEYFQTADPSVVMQQEKICGTYIEQKLLPLFKYQMLRVRASMTGSYGHLRPEAEQKFKEANQLLERWGIPVNPELERYIRF